MRLLPGTVIPNTVRDNMKRGNILPRFTRDLTE